MDLPVKFKSLIVAPLSDAHFGSHYFSGKHFERTLRYVDDNSPVYVVVNGDLCESSIKTSKGDIFKQVGTPQDQRDWMIEKLYPIRNKILGCTTGNHEERIYRECGIDISKDIANALGVPYRPEGIMLKISFGDNNNGTKGKPYVYFCYATHGYGGARTASAKAVKVERTSTFVHADFYIMSHDHVSNAAPAIYLMPDNRTVLDTKTGFRTGSVKAQRKLLVKSNAYLMWGGYGERGGFSPTDLEVPLIMLSGEGQPQVRVLI